jgi:hypothetical protein
MNTDDGEPTAARLCRLCCPHLRASASICGFPTLPCLEHGSFMPYQCAPVWISGSRRPLSGKDVRVRCVRCARGI